MNLHIYIACYLNVQWEFSKSFLKQLHHIHNSKRKQDNPSSADSNKSAKRVCIYYRRLNQETRKDHLLLPFIDQMLEHLAGKSNYCFLDGFSSYFQIHIAPEDKEKMTFTCPLWLFCL